MSFDFRGRLPDSLPGPSIDTCTTYRACARGRARKGPRAVDNRMPLLIRMTREVPPLLPTFEPAPFATVTLGARAETASVRPGQRRKWSRCCTHRSSISPLGLWPHPQHACKIEWQIVKRGSGSLRCPKRGRDSRGDNILRCGYESQPFPLLLFLFLSGR